MCEQQYQKEVMDELAKYVSEIKQGMFGNQILNTPHLLYGAISQLQARDKFYERQNNEINKQS